MKYEVRTVKEFERSFKKLHKKYPSLKKDIASLILILEKSPQTGTPLGSNFYKIRLAITSKTQGKSGGARVITFVHYANNIVFLSAIYDKSEVSNISDSELKRIAKYFK